MMAQAVYDTYDITAIDAASIHQDDMAANIRMVFIGTT